MGKILALFLIAYFGLYLYRRWKYKRTNSIGKVKYYERELAKKDYEESDVIDVDLDDDDSQPPKYLH